MKRCPECGGSFEDDRTHCPEDGAELPDRPLPQDPFIGRILAGRYEVLALLGRGGFGVVYKARDRKMDDVVAVKVFDRRRFTEDEARQAIQRFRREGVILRRLGKRTNHIVIVYDFEEVDEDDLIFFTMDFVDGVTLAKVLADEGPPPLPRALELAIQICQALKAAHAEGIIHRDLKLENVMVTREGDRETVKVLDFGIAKMVGSQSLTNLALGVPGTAGFAPPEQLQRPRDIDHRTDLFSLGVVLYGLVTGRGPWSGEPISEPTSSEKVWDLIRNSLEKPPIPLREWSKDVPRRLEILILKLLEKDQARRIQSAALLEEELKKVRDELLRPPGSGGVRRPFATFGAAARRIGIPPALAVAGVLAVLVGASAVVRALTPGNAPGVLQEEGVGPADASLYVPEGGTLEDLPVEGPPAARGPPAEPSIVHPAGDSTPSPSEPIPGPGTTPAVREILEADTSSETHPATARADPEGREWPAVPTTAPPRDPTPDPVRTPLSVSDLAIRGFRFLENQFQVDASYSAVGPGTDPVCVASIFGNQDREPYRDSDGEFALGGLVATTETHTPGPAGGRAAVRHVLPVAQIHLDRGTLRVVAMTRIWSGGCGRVDPSTPPLAQAVTEPICIVRYPAGWGVCRG